MRSKAEKEAKKVHNILSFLRIFSRKGVVFVLIRANITESCDTKQRKAEEYTKIGDFIESESVSRCEKGGESERKKVHLIQRLSYTKRKKRKETRQ